MKENLKKVIVLNRQQAIELTENDCSVDRAIISISSVGDEPPKFKTNNSIKNILYLNFNDEEEGPLAIQNEQAKKIASFVNELKDQIEQFVVHCDAGVSRSAGVAAAILKYLINDDTSIFDNPQYYPNRRCYRYTLNALTTKNDFKATDSLYDAIIRELNNEVKKLNSAAKSLKHGDRHVELEYWNANEAITSIQTILISAGYSVDFKINKIKVPYGNADIIYLIVDSFNVYCDVRTNKCWGNRI